jgi:hypothetical protein
MVEEERNKNSLNLLSVISKTIERQVLGLATTIAWYNHHRLIVFPKYNLFEVTVGGLRYTGDLERLEDLYNKEEKYWKRFFEKSSEEKYILTMESLLSDIPSVVKEFVEKNDTTGGRSFLENSSSVGNQNSNEEEDESKSVEEISHSSLHKTQLLQQTSPIYSKGVCALSEVVWGKEVSGKLKGSDSSQFKAQPVQKFGGPRIRLTARKRVPQIFEKFTWNSAQAKSASPSPIRESTNESSPICTPDPRGDPSKKHDLHLDLVRETHNLHAQAQALGVRDPTCEGDPRVLQLQHPIRGFDPRLCQDPTVDSPVHLLRSVV